jgi:hypothetical protein
LARVLEVNRFGNSEHKRTIWDVDSAAGDGLVNYMNPAYWSNIARNLRPKDRIEVTCEDNSHFCELYVFEAGMNWVKVGLLRFEEFGQNAAQHGLTNQGTPEYKITFGGNLHKWRVIRTSDGECLTKNQPLATEKAAEDWLFEYRKALAK